MTYLMEKFGDKAFDFILNFLVKKLQIISPLKIIPRKIFRQTNPHVGSIFELNISNRLNSSLYDVLIAGISIESFSIDVIADSGAAIGKTVKHMEINTDRMIVEAVDRRNDNHLWIFRIYKLSPKETLTLRLKAKNNAVVCFKVLNHSS